MTYVITQSCCSDATCVLDCPVDCIRPVPGDPLFASAEMLYIDPDSCIDCGACQEACPVSAVYAEEDLPPELRHFSEFNAGYFLRHPLEPAAHAVPKPARPAPEHGELTVAIIGTGPAASYLAEDLLERANVKINMVEKLPTPWGLLRSGVAPDHLSTKNLSTSFERTLKSTSLRYYLNVEVGRDVAVDDLFSSHHAVVVATGAVDPAPWNVPGAELRGVHPATDFVGWYNGHPEHAHLQFDLSCERVVVIGNGNVALDVARVLLLGPEALRASDIAEHARTALEASMVKEVVVAGRRGLLEAAYTASEFSALRHLEGVDVAVSRDDMVSDTASRSQMAGPDPTYSDELKLRVAVEAAEQSSGDGARRLIFRYLAEPTRVHGGTRVERVEFARNELKEKGGRIVPVRAPSPGFVEPAGLVFTSIGYRGRALDGVPFDQITRTIPNRDGRILAAQGRPTPGLYVTGWAKRGASGGIGAGRADAHETAATIVADFNTGLLRRGHTDLDSVLADSDCVAVSYEGWAAIDAHERRLGSDVGRPRIKLVDVDTMLQVAVAGI